MIIVFKFSTTYLNQMDENVHKNDKHELEIDSDLK